MEVLEFRDEIEILIFDMVDVFFWGLLICNGIYGLKISFVSCVGWWLFCILCFRRWEVNSVCILLLLECVFVVNNK